MICFLRLQVHEFCRIDGLVKLHHKPLLQLEIQQFPTDSLLYSQKQLHTVKTLWTKTSNWET